MKRADRWSHQSIKGGGTRMTRWKAAIVLLMVATTACGADEERAHEVELAAAAAYEKGKTEATESLRKASEDAERAATAAAASQEQEAEQRAGAVRQEADDRIQKEKVALRRTPARFFEITETSFHDKGIVNSYRQLLQATVLNKSHFAVTDVSGDVVWSMDDGTSIGSTTFALAGSLPAGETKVYRIGDGTLTAGTIQGAATKWKVRVTHVEIVE